jgi:uncharacterized metal-binding protein
MKKEKITMWTSKACMTDAVINPQSQAWQNAAGTYFNVKIGQARA